MLRNFAKRHEHGLSTVTKSRLSDLATEHQRIADDDNAIAKEAKENEDHGQLLRKAAISTRPTTIRTGVGAPVKSGF